MCLVRDCGYSNAPGNGFRSCRLAAASRIPAVIPQHRVDQKFYAALIPVYTKFICWTLQQSQHHDCETNEFGAFFETLTSLVHSEAPEFDEQIGAIDAIFHSTINSERLLAAAEFRFVDDLNDIAIRCPVSLPGEEHRRPTDGQYVRLSHRASRTGVGRGARGSPKLHQLEAELDAARAEKQVAVVTSHTHNLQHYIQCKHAFDRFNSMRICLTRSNFRVQQSNDWPRLSSARRRNRDRARRHRADTRRAVPG
jgi:hypothetical protein